MVVLRLPALHSRGNATGARVGQHRDLLGGLHGDLRAPERVGPHDHELVTEQQGLTVRRPRGLVEIIADPIGPQLGVAGEPGDAQPLGERGDGQPRQIGRHPAEPVTQRGLSLRGQECQRLCSGVVAIELGVPGRGLVELLSSCCNSSSWVMRTPASSCASGWLRARWPESGP